MLRMYIINNRAKVLKAGPGPQILIHQPEILKPETLNPLPPPQTLKPP